MVTCYKFKSWMHHFYIYFGVFFIQVFKYLFPTGEWNNTINTNATTTALKGGSKTTTEWNSSNIISFINKCNK